LSETANTSRYDDRAVWRIAAPMMLSYISVPLLGMVDSAVVGHLDSPVFLGAVAIGATIFNFLFLGMNFLRMGTTGLTAQVHGRQDPDEARTVLAQGVLTALALAAALLLLQLPLRSAAIALVGPSVDVAELTATYFGVRVWSAPFVLINFVLIGWFVGVQDGRAPLVMMLATNIVNIVLDLWFVVGLGWDVAGVAAASVIAEGFGMLVGIGLIRRHLRRWPGHWLRGHILDLLRIRRLFAINGNLWVRTLTLMFAFGFLTAMGARQGDLILAANAVLLNFQSFMAYGLDAFALAAEALIGRAVGAKDRAGLNRAFGICLRWSLYFALAFAALMALAGMPATYLITDIDAVRAAVTIYLPWMIVSPLISHWSFFYDGVYVGVTRAREMRDTMLISCFAFYLPTWWLLQQLGWGNHGLWAAFMVFMAARGLTMHLLWRRMTRDGRVHLA
jgi:MATE family, multidrug efflux pump